MWFNCSLGTKRVTGVGQRQGLNAVDIVLMRVKNIRDKSKEEVGISYCVIFFTLIIDLDVCVSKVGDRQLCTFGCLQNRAPMELLLPLH